MPVRGTLYPISWRYVWTVKTNETLDPEVNRTFSESPLAVGKYPIPFPFSSLYENHFQSKYGEGSSFLVGAISV